MADNTKIEWTDATWNPVTGCTVKSPGCTNCYAMKLAGTRLQHHPSRSGLTAMTKAGPVWNGQVRFNEQWIDQPLRWKRPRMIFVCAHGDLFAPGVQREWQARVFDVMHDADQHIYQVLTKRPGELASYIENFRPLSHVWLGCSVEDQTRADERRESMRRLAEMGWLTWVSYEPALGPVDWTGWEFLRWMVSGGESGNGARPSHPGWHRTTRDWCATNAIAYHFKQWGAYLPSEEADDGRGIYFVPADGGDDDRLIGFRPRPVSREFPDQAMWRVGKKAAGRLLDGRTHDEFPERLP